MKQYVDASIIRTSPPGRLPLEISVKGPRLGGFAPMIAPTALGVIAILVTLNAMGGLPRDIPVMTIVAGLVLALFLAGAVLLYGPRGTRSCDYRIDSGRVHCYARGFAAGVTWTEALTSYSGARWERYAEMRSGQNSTQSDPIFHHVMALAHPDPGKAVPLLRYSSRHKLFQVLPLLIRSKFTPSPTAAQRAAMQEEAHRLARKLSEADLRAEWEGFARLLGVPAIDARDGAEAVRPVANLDTPIQTLAAEGKLERDEAAWDPPPSLDLVRVGSVDDPDGQRLRVTIRRSALGWFNLLLVGGGAALVVTGAVLGTGGLLLAGLPFAGIGAGLWYLQRRLPRRLEITRHDLTHVNPAIDSDNFTIPFKAIESVYLRDARTERVHGVAPNLSGRELVVATDEDERSIGAGLPVEALEWLRRTLLAAIAEA